MNLLNQIIIEGTCKGNAQVETTGNGTKCCTVSIINYFSYRNRNHEVVREESRFDVKSYGLLAETLSTRLTDGRNIRVVGRLKQEVVEGSDGMMHSRSYIIAEHIEVMPVKEEAEETRF